MKYSKQFIILKQDRLGYSFRGKDPSGRAIIEVSGNEVKLLISIQNLRPESLYKVFLIKGSDQKSVGVLAGTACPNQLGNCEMRYLTSSDDIFDSGIAIGAINVVAIMVSGGEEVIAPLVGYSGEAFRWKNNFTNHALLKEQAMKPVEKAETQESNVCEPIEEAFSDDVKASPQLPSQSEWDEEVKEFLSHVPHESPVQEPIHIQEEEELWCDIPQAEAKEILVEVPCDELGETAEPDWSIPPELPSPSVEWSVPSVESISSPEEYIAEIPVVKEEYVVEIPVVNETIQYSDDTNIYDLFDSIEHVRPFVKQNKEVDWIQIGKAELELLVVDSKRVKNNAFVLSCLNRYGHLIFGRGCHGDNEKCYLGVPDIYNHEYKLAAYRLGFSQFKAVEDVQIRNGEFGYWIMTINKQ